MRLRAELRGIDEAIEHTDLAHVMVIGDTQVGKTSLLLRLLGVTDPVAAEQAAVPLRGGRDRAESATAVPIRYQWSGDQDSWSLVHGAQQHTEWLTCSALEAKLASFRTGEGDHLRWDPADRPLEVGLPEWLAGPSPRRDLRVFDLPGLHASGDQERDVARALVRTYAPVMNFIIFVLPGDQFAEVVRDPAITENPFLANWGNQPERFNLVFTRAFSNAKVSEHLVEQLGPPRRNSWDRDRVIETTRKYFDAQLALSGLPSGGMSTLFPIEIGESWRELVQGIPADADYAAEVGPANDWLLGRLGETITGFSDEESAYLAAPEIATRVETLVHDNRRRRAARMNTVENALASATGARENADALTAKAEQHLLRVTEHATQLQNKVGDLAKRSINYQRPEAPEMTGPLVRGKQEEERTAWTEAARSTWEKWRRQTGGSEFPALPPHDLTAGVRTEYDRLCSCCQQCETNWFKRAWRASETPEHCYGKMTNVADDLQTWIRSALKDHACPTVEAAEKQARAARRKVGLARRNAIALRAEEMTARQVLDTAREETAQEESEDARNLEVARSVRAVHNEQNEKYVRELLTRAGTAGDDERGLLFLAALRGLYDLDRMFKR